MDTQAPRKSAAPARERRRRRRRRRVAALSVFALIALAIGLVVGANYVGSGEKSARYFAVAWNRGDYDAMYAQLTPTAAAAVSQKTFKADYETVLNQATATSVTVGKPKQAGSTFRVPVVIHTRIFGTVHGVVVLPMAETDAGKRVAWSRDLVFPGLTPETHLKAIIHMPPRGTILARDGTALAKGPDRTSGVSDVAAQVVGALGPIPAEDVAADTAQGVPADARVGISGLERILDEQLRGRPGGTLMAGDVVLAKTKPKRAKAVRTTISIPIERAATTALAQRLGGVVAIKPKTGEILAFAGIAFSGLQPPGSTFKIITTTGALENHLASTSTVFPYASYATLSGVRLNNANGENCGGTLALSFATSCNSVFAPLGAKLGPTKLVGIAERFGFNAPPGIRSAATSTLPAPADIGDDLAVGSSAIGQGKVQATTLQMAIVAATIAHKGLRPTPTLLAHSPQPPAKTTRVTSAHVAHMVKDLMIGVVRGGTGVSAQIPGVVVAGKTGTAELQSTQPCTPDQVAAAGTSTTTTPVTNPEGCALDPSDPTLTDAWFTAFAPAADPRIVVCVMLVKDGAGGDTAAPAARDVMIAGLKALS